jgi:sucrose-6-phosphate hydrolase SacC (GH32 family)
MKYLINSLLILTLFISAKSDSKYYNEKYRPQVHFSPEKNWLFESNGFIYSNGEYHLFYQNIAIEKKVFHNQLGHAVSKDMIHWKHLPFAFTPDEKAIDVATCRPMAGSVILDSLNVSGLKQKEASPMLIYYSDSDGNQNMAFSNDLGITWEKYSQNPILLNPGEEAQDPKVFYHKPSGKWILALYRAKGEGVKAGGISLYSSSDLLRWKYESHLEGFGECPDLFEVAFEERPSDKRWVVLSGEGEYKVGSFDGTVFKAETELRQLDSGKNFFSSQTLSNSPDGKVIQIAWMRGGEFPEMVFNGQMSIPVELTLRSTPIGAVLCRKPISSLSVLYDDEVIKKDKNLIPGIKGNLLGGIKGDAVFIKMVVNPKTADSFGLIVRNGKKSNGTDVHYDTAKKTLDVNGCKMILEPINGKIELQILVDRSSIEVFGNKGLCGISTCFTPVDGEDELLLYTQGGELFVESLEAYTLKTAWSGK